MPFNPGNPMAMAAALQGITPQQMAEYIVRGTVHRPEAPHGPLEIHGEFGDDLSGALQGLNTLRQIYRPNDPDALKLEAK